MDGITEGALASISTDLAVLAAKSTATTVANKFKAIRTNKSITEVCNSYEEIINDLVADRAQAIAVAQAYASELNRYEITEGDIVHLQRTISEALDILKSFSPETDVASYEQFKSLISVDTLKAMQLLGFDYRAAIGDPLTRACAAAIEAKLKVKNNSNNHPSGSSKSSHR